MPLSRRELVKVGMGAAAYHGIPALGRNVAPQVPSSCDALALSTPNARWSNKHNNIAEHVEQLYRPLNRAMDCARLAKGEEWQGGLGALKPSSERPNARVNECALWAARGRCRGPPPAPIS